MVPINFWQNLAPFSGVVDSCMTNIYSFKRWHQNEDAPKYEVNLNMKIKATQKIKMIQELKKTPKRRWNKTSPFSARVAAMRSMQQQNHKTEIH